MKVFGGAYLTQQEVQELGFRSCGTNVLIHEHANLVGLENISIGNNVRIDSYTCLIAGTEGYISIGDYSFIGSFCYLAGGAGITLDDFTTLAPGVRIHSTSDDYSGMAMTNSVVPEEFTAVEKGAVVLKKHTIIGSGSTVLPKSILEEGSSIGAMSLVNASTESWTIYGGSPIRKIKKRNTNARLLEEKLRAKYG